MHEFIDHLLILLLIEGVPTILVAALAWALGRQVGWLKFGRFSLVAAYANVGIAAFLGVKYQWDEEVYSWIGAFAVAMLFALICYFAARFFDADDNVRAVRQRRQAERRTRALYTNLER